MLWGVSWALAPNTAVQEEDGEGTLQRIVSAVG
jgi:hypothetical protein